jgi:YD repeat-containing protein
MTFDASGNPSACSATLVEYDLLGRVKRQSVPTEINSNWTPSGDDAIYPNFLWTSQEYDWKSRPIREINTDGTDKLISYNGCGCAGGQVTTTESENLTQGRRKQKTYSDILGRTYKTEILDWNGSIYNTIINNFNGRDQVTQTRHYAGTESSNSYQDVTMTYDGFGRMKTRHYPIEDNNATTTWNYNIDNSIQQIIDPRGATQNFVYHSNNGLLNQINYTVPSGSNIPVTPTVTYGYNNLGMRTQMVDGTGTTTYNYNSLSQLTSETKQFTGLTGNFTIGYSYQMNGSLKSITDPFNSTVNYAHDKIGRLSNVNGTSYAQNTNGNYASNFKYRAFGSLKQMDYTMPDDTSQIKMEYDNRLRVNHSEVSSSQVLGGYLLKADFSYFADSRVQGKDDLLDNKWDRTMQYDFMGRMTFNQFGMGQGTNNNQKRVYEQTVSYDSFSMMTGRSGVHWDNDIGYSESYVKGRIQNNPAISYDAAGNIVHSGDNANPHIFQHTYFDASGKRTGTHESNKGRWGNQLNMVTESKHEMMFDGDGRFIIEKKGFRNYHVNDPPPPATWQPDAQTYQMWSTVLSENLTTITNDGSKLITNVFAGGAVIAQQKRFANNPTQDAINWITNDPVTGTRASFNYTHESTGRNTNETEPLGQNIHLQDPEDQASPNNGTVGSADFPQWQYQAPDSFYGGSDGRPWHCQMADMLSKAQNGDTLYAVYEEKSNPIRALGNQDDRLPNLGLPNSVSDITMTYASKVTRKPSSKDDNNPESKGNRGKRTFTVDVDIPAIDMSEIPGYVDANVGSFEPPPPVFDEEKLKEAITYCARLHFKKAKNLKTTSITPVTNKQNGVISFSQNGKSFEVETGNNFDSGEIKEIVKDTNNKDYSSTTIYGLTFETSYAKKNKTYTYNGVTVRTDPKTANYVAKNLTGIPGIEGLEQKLGTGLATQIHELGHSLSARFLGQSDYKNKTKVGDGGWIKEIGWQFENCVDEQYSNE